MKFKDKSALDVIAMGRSTCDIYSLEIGDLKDSKTFARYLGGSPANTAAAMSKLHMKVGFIGKVSDDGMGQFVRNSLSAFGVDTQGLKTDTDGHLTGITIGEIKGDGKCSSLMYRSDCADLYLHPDDIDEGYIASAKALLVSGTSLSRSPARESVFTAITKAKSNQTKVIFDPDYRSGTWLNMQEASTYLALCASHADIVIGTEEEMQIVWQGLGKTGPLNKRLCADYLTDTGVEIVVIKAGRNGSTAYTKDGTVSAASFHQEKVLKTFGAGDSFASAFIHALINGRDLKECQIEGAGAAAITITGHSCSEAAPTLEQLEEFLSRNTDNR